MGRVFDVGLAGKSYLHSQSTECNWYLCTEYIGMYVLRAHVLGFVTSSGACGRAGEGN